MTLRKFEDAYKDAVKELPECHMDLERVLDEEHHAEFPVSSVKRNGRGRKVWTRTAAVAAGLFILCGVGTVTAINYQKSIITVKENGYSVIGQRTAEGNYINGETVEGIVLDEGSLEEGIALASEVDGGISQGDEEDMKLMSADEDAEAYDELEVVETMEYFTYTSMEEFYASADADIVVAIPPLELLGEFEEQNIVAAEDGTYFSLMFYSEGKWFSLSQQDTRGFEQYASSTTYMGESANERTVMNDQGLSYVVFDTLEDGVVASSHAVISVNGRDLCMDFYGYEEMAMENVLKTLDLSIYFQEEQ